MAQRAKATAVAEAMTVVSTIMSRTVPSGLGRSRGGSARSARGRAGCVGDGVGLGVGVGSRLGRITGTSARTALGVGTGRGGVLRRGLRVSVGVGLTGLDAVGSGVGAGLRVGVGLGRGRTAAGAGRHVPTCTVRTGASTQIETGGALHGPRSSRSTGRLTHTDTPALDRAFGPGPASCGSAAAGPDAPSASKAPASNSRTRFPRLLPRRRHGRPRSGPLLTVLRRAVAPAMADTGAPPPACVVAGLSGSREPASSVTVTRPRRSGRTPPARPGRRRARRRGGRRRRGRCPRSARRRSPAGPPSPAAG
ncbi:MAG: hypothetical protein K0R62_2590 [Nonomuraea muscovyensis]|nr:hypothetical protein [Nonomuraea muscovyensis]